MQFYLMHYFCFEHKFFPILFRMLILRFFAFSSTKYLCFFFFGRGWDILFGLPRWIVWPMTCECFRSGLNVRKNGVKSRANMRLSRFYLAFVTWHNVVNMLVHNMNVRVLKVKLWMMLIRLNVKSYGRFNKYSTIILNVISSHFFYCSYPN